MNKFRKIVSTVLLLAVTAVVSSCGYDATYDLACEECEKVAEQYLDALIEGDYDTMEELSFYEEDYDDIHNYQRLTYDLDGSLAQSSDSYNGYYMNCRFEMNGKKASCLIYFSYIKAEKSWMINVIDSESDTVLYGLEKQFFGED